MYKTGTFLEIYLRSLSKISEKESTNACSGYRISRMDNFLNIIYGKIYKNCQKEKGQNTVWLERIIQNQGNNIQRLRWNLRIEWYKTEIWSKQGWMTRMYSPFWISTCCFKWQYHLLLHYRSPIRNERKWNHKTCKVWRKNSHVIRSKGYRFLWFLKVK